MKTITSLGIVVITVVLFSVLQCAYIWAGQAAHHRIASRLLGSIAFALGCVLWVVADASAAARLLADFDFLVAVFFPVSLVWYAFWSRGVRGVLVLGAMLGLMLIPWLAAIVVLLLRYGLA